MSKTVRMTSDDPLSAEAIEQLKRLAEMPDDLIDTSDIPDRHFNLELAAKRRKEGWKPGTNGQLLQKKAS
ncbi:MAG: hypothetical protein V4555_02930 [Acidobacteriota bacterium]